MSAELQTENNRMAESAVRSVIDLERKLNNRIIADKLSLDQLVFPEMGKALRALYAAGKTGIEQIKDAMPKLGLGFVRQIAKTDAKSTETAGKAKEALSASEPKTTAKAKVSIV